MTKTNAHYIELDIVDEDYDTLDAAIDSLIHDLPVTATIVSPRTPTRWATVHFSSPRYDALVALLNRYTDDPDDALDLAEAYIELDD